MNESVGEALGEGRRARGLWVRLVAVAGQLRAVSGGRMEDRGDGREGGSGSVYRPPL